MKPETYFKIKVARRLKLIPGLYFFKSQEVSVRGILDIIICYRGKFIAWELKSKEGKPSALQTHTITKIKEAGGVGEVVYPDNFEEKLRDLLE